MHNFTIIIGVAAITSGEFFSKTCSIESRLLSTRACPYPGFIAQLIGRYVHATGHRFTVVQFEGAARNGYELMLNGTIDMMATDMWYITAQRLAKDLQFSTTFSLQRTYSALLSDGQQNEGIAPSIGALRQYTQIFGPVVWLVGGLSYVAYKLLTIARQQRIFARANWSSFSLLLVGVEFLAGLALAFYGNSLLANILRPHDTVAFNDFQGMLRAVAENRIRLVKKPRVGWYDAFLHDAKSLSDARQFRETMTDYAPHEEASFEQRLRLINTGSHFQVMPSYEAEWETNVRCYLKCVTIAEFGSMLIGIMYSPKTPRAFITAVNEQMMKSYLETQYLYSRYVKHARRKHRLECHRSESHSISLGSISVAFYVLGLCFAAAAILCYAECCFWLTI